LKRSRVGLDTAQQLDQAIAARVGYNAAQADNRLRLAKSVVLGTTPACEVLKGHGHGCGSVRFDALSPNEQGSFGCNTSSKMMVFQIGAARHPG
jgi:hypothetical protein